MAPGRTATALVRLAARLYPKEFRAALGADLEAVFEREHAATLASQGRTAAFILTIRTLAGVPAAAWRERRRNTTTRSTAWAELPRRWAKDALYGVRIWRKTPGHALIAVLALALGIGVNLAVLNLIVTLFFSAPPARNPEELVFAIGMDARSTPSNWAFSLADRAAIAERSATLDDVAAQTYVWANLTDGALAVEMRGALVTGNFFEILGMQPAAGRFFGSAEDAVIDRDAVAVLSHDDWQRLYGGDPGVVGRTVYLNTRAFTIVGVGPAGFSGLFVEDEYDLWIPASMSGIDGEVGQPYAEDYNAFDLMARRAPGVPLEEARAEIQGLAGQLFADGRDGGDLVGAFVMPIRGATSWTRQFVGRTPLLAAAVAGCLLLVTCLNLAGLVLARNVARRREFATRRAIGASRASLLGQLVTEAFVLAAAAGFVGVASAVWAQRLIEEWYAYYLPGLRLSIDAADLLGAIVLVVGTATFLGLVPALRASRADVMGSIKAPSYGAARSWFGDAPGRSLVVIGQIALSLMLLMGAAVMLRSVERILASAGSSPGDVLHYRLRPSRVGYDTATGEAFQRQLLRRVSAVPGVAAATLARVGPERGFCCPLPVSTPGRFEDPDDSDIVVSNNDVTPAFFDALRVPVLRGRGLRDSDLPGAPLVVVVNQALAERLWPLEEPLGRTLLARGSPYTVVGIAPDLYPPRHGEGPVPYAYFSYWQAGLLDARMYVRVSGDPGTMLETVRAEITAIDPDMHIGQEGTLEERMRLSMAAEQVLLGVLRSCAAAALVLSALGLYGQLSLSVGQRTRDIGIRMALGAPARRVLVAEVGRGMRLLVIGLGVGLFAAWAQGRLLVAYVAGVGAGEPLLLAGSMLVLLTVGAAAALLPARRAARVDPMGVLRGD